MKTISTILPAIVMLLCILNDAAAADDKEWALASRLFSDSKARRVGDILTVVIEEETETSKDASSSSSKKSGMSGSMSFGHPRLDNNPTSWTNAVVPSWSVDTSRSFEGSGSAGNKDKFVSRIACRVMEVLPNGNLLIEGSRTVIIQEETITMILSGTVRPTDIAQDNTVNSTMVADATIKYESSGPVARETKRGLVSRLWNWVNPF